jgi:hypothetical protein
VIRELTVTVPRNDQVVAVIGVGNKPKNYTDDALEAAQLLVPLPIDAGECERAEARIEHLAYQDAHTHTCPTERC